MFNNLGAGEILIVLVVLIFLFGGKKLPEIAKGLGQSGREIKKAKKQIQDALADIDTDENISESKSTEGGEP